MKLQKNLNKLILSSLIFSSIIEANDNTNIISKDLNKILNYSYDKSIQDSKKLRNDWINPIIYKYN